MMDAIQRAVPVPEAEVIMHGAFGRQVFGQIAPLAAGAQYVHHTIDHLAHVDAPLAATPLGGRNKGFRLDPFLVGQIARIAQLVAVVTGTVSGGPHGAPHETNRCHPENHMWFGQFKRLIRLIRLTDSSDSHCLRTDTYGLDGNTVTYYGLAPRYRTDAGMSGYWSTTPGVEY